MTGLAVAAGSFVAAAGSSRLLLAMVGALGGLGAALLSTSVGALAALAAFRAVAGRSPAGGRASTTAHVGAGIAVLVAVLAAAWSSYASSNHVLIDRDPGSYVATAKWIEQAGTLTVRDPAAGFGDAEGIELSSAAVYQVDSGDLEFQFMHLPSAMAAMGAEIGGDRLLFATGALVAAAALLSVYAVAVRFTGAPLASVAVVAAVAACMPFVYVARDLFSEPFAMLFVWSGILALSVASELRSRPASVLGGALIGATALARVDGYILVALLFVACGAAVLFARPEHLADKRRNAGLAAGGATVVAGFAAIDVLGFSGGYPDSLRSQLLQSMALLAAAAVVGIAAAILGPRLATSRSISAKARRVAGATCGGAVAMMMLAAWLVRPRLQEVRGGTQIWGLIGDLQVAEGLERDLFRRYSEQTMEWMAWYLGAFTLLLAIVGLALLVGLIWTTRVPTDGALAALFVLGTGAVYWWGPRNTPDHIWVMRRFLPVILPGLVLFAVFAVVYATAKLADHWRRPIVVAATLAIVTSAALPTMPVWLMREQHGFDLGLVALCDRLPGNSSVVVVGDFEGQALPQAIRSWCGLPAARLAVPQLTASALEQIEASTRAVGRDLAVVTIRAEEADKLTSLLGQPLHVTDTIVAESRLEPTVERRPSRYMDSDEEFWSPAGLQFFIW